MTSPAAVQVRKATKADVAGVSLALARAFHDDPVMAWLFPGADKEKRIRRFFAMDLGKWNLKHDCTYTTVGDIAGGAIWAPPGKWKLPPTTMLRSMPAMIAILGRQLPTALRGLTLIEKKHPREPHYYLGVLGTAPEHQGKGVGGALMAPVLETCDRDGIGAYLESSKESNVPYYRRFGFEVTEELTLPGGPPIWLMWRDPQGK